MRASMESANLHVPQKASADSPSPQSDSERLKSELELIGYITSHDLQAPLRIISRSCEELNAHSGFTGDELSRTLLNTLTSQSAHMKKMLEEMLEYVRLETFAVKASSLDTNEIVETVMTALGEEISTAHATITYDPLPVVMGHRGRITRLFAHLLDNAIKFRSETTPAIHISARRLGEQWEFCVADNGIGIDPEFHYIIFTLFQRLHASDAYPGIGAGLAHSRKIVESHGGVLRVESALGQGCRFYFTLPVA